MKKNSFVMVKFCTNCFQKTLKGTACTGCGQLLINQVTMDSYIRYIENLYESAKIREVMKANEDP